MRREILAATGALVLALVACKAPANPAEPKPYFATQQNVEDEERVNAIIIANLRLEPGMKVVDIGAGQGSLTFAAACDVYPGGRVYATDIDPSALQSIQERSSHSAKPCVRDTIETRFVREGRDTAVDDLDPDSVSLALLLRVLTFREPDRTEDVAYLRKLVRILSPGGRFIYHMDWLDRPGYEAYLTALFVEAGFSPRVETVALPKHIPAETRGRLDPSGPLKTLYRGGIWVFVKPASSPAAR